MKKIRVMIVEDSHVVREYLQYLIARDPRLMVAAAVPSAEAALQALHRVSPDVISMDIRLPGMNGFEATQRIMVEKPTPIVVVAGSVESDDLKISLNALRAGALAVVEKPVSTSHQDYEQLADRICTQLALMSQVKVIRQRLPRKNHWSPAEPALREKAPAPVLGSYRMLGVVASTGGPAALLKLLGGLDRSFPQPIVLVQHITSSFLEGFASWLDSACGLPVHVARDGDWPLPGRVYVAPPDWHLTVESDRLRLTRGEPVSAQRPSGTILFRSMADALGPKALGVLLTGMGDDGAAGLKAIRDAGGYTIAEDESTAVVYGMPGVAAQIGAVCESLPLYEIADRVRRLCEGGRHG